MGDGYLMLYGGLNGSQTTSIGVATSDDGITWVKDPEPVLAGGQLRQAGRNLRRSPTPDDDR